MARGNVLTPEELAKLGAKQLAELLVEACQSNPQLRHRVEILQASTKSTDELEGTLAKRIVSLSRACSVVDWRKVPELEAELVILREGIVWQLGAEEPRLASELMWRFLAVAKPTIERVDDSSGRIGDEFRCAAEDLGCLLTRVPNLDRIKLAKRLHEGMAEDEYGFAALIINSAPEALGAEGRKKLRELLKADGVDALAAWVCSPKLFEACFDVTRLARRGPRSLICRICACRTSICFFGRVSEILNC